MSDSNSNSEAQVSLLQSLLQLPASWARLIALALAAAVSLAVVALFSGSLHSIEERIGALGWTLSPDETAEERITLVVIDEKSIAEVGPWPWARADIARLVTAIDKAGAQLQLHDIVYPESRAGDDLVTSAVAQSSGVVFAQIPVFEGQNAPSQVGSLTHPLANFGCATSSAASQFPLASSFVAPTAGFSAIPKGHIGAIIDSDGAVRKSPALFCNDGQLYPALSISAFLQLGSAEQWGGRLVDGGSLFAPSAYLQLDGYPGLDIPVDAEGNLRISFARSPASFLALSASDVMNGRVDPAILDGAWVIVGGTAFGMGDIVPTPYSGATPGVELQARLLTSLLDVDVPFTPAGSPWFLMLVASLFAAVLLAIASQGERIVSYGLPVAAVTLPTFAVALHVTLLSSSNVWIGWMAPAVYGFCAASALLLLELARVRMERSRVYGNLNSYLPQEVAHDIAFSLPSGSIKAERLDVTLLHADLRNFSAFGESRPPEEIAAVLHYFFTRATEIIECHGGRVHEFKGDSVLAMWDGADRVAAVRALQSAHDMQEALNDRLLPEQALKGLEPLALGIGIEQGPVLVGSIGPAHRRSHTLLGDTVGITLRIQEMTAELAQPILIGECAARQLSDSKLESQGSYLLSGHRIPHTLFAPPAMANVTTVSGSELGLKVISGGKQ